MSLSKLFSNLTRNTSTIGPRIDNIQTSIRKVVTKVEGTNSKKQSQAARNIVVAQIHEKRPK